MHQVLKHNNTNTNNNTISSNTTMTTTDENGVGMIEGWVGVVLAVLFFGSCNVMVKTKKVSQTNVNPFVFQLYMSFAIFVSSWFVLLWTPFSFGYHGMLGSAMWVPGQIQAVMAVRLVGLGMGQAMWSGMVVMVSFLWGIIAFRETPQSWPLTVLGLGLLIAAFFGISMSGLKMPNVLAQWKKRKPKADVVQQQQQQQQERVEVEGMVMEGKDEKKVDVEHGGDLGNKAKRSRSMGDIVMDVSNDLASAEEKQRQEAHMIPSASVTSMISSHSTDTLLTMNRDTYKSTNTTNIDVVMPTEADAHYAVSSGSEHDMTSDGYEQAKTRSKFKQGLEKIRGPAFGMLFVSGVGLCAGSTMVPARLNPDQTVAYVVSFGTGAMIVALLLFLLYVLAIREIPEFHFRTTFLPGFVSGVVWSIGNLGSTYASMSPLGLSVGYPLTQCALVVSGLWGLFVFRELKGVRPVMQFFISACVLLGGCALLGVFGTSLPE